jgi:hypothetical protein
MPLLTTVGAASGRGFGQSTGAQGVFIEDVFSTYTYNGTGSAQTITNNIDLSTKGGLVWMKSSSAIADHALYDTARGATFDLTSTTTAAPTTQATGLTAFNTNGFSIGALAKVNINGGNFVSWTFEKQAKFFDIVTYTGTGANRTIAHNLGSVPGWIVVKRTDSTGNWAVYHRSLANTEFLLLNTTQDNDPADATYWNSTTATSSVFSVGTNTDVNASAGTYVAYIFAHNAGGFGLNGAENGITCGSFSTNASGVSSVNLGYEPQWVLIKRIGVGVSGDWVLYDYARGLNSAPTNGAPDTQELYPNTTGAQTFQQYFLITATGFETISGTFTASASFIYIAIRRGPMKVPTVGTSVFSATAYTGNGATQNVSSSTVVAPDIFWTKYRSGTPGSTEHNLWNKLSHGTKWRFFPSSTTVRNFAVINSINMSGVGLPVNYANTNAVPYIGWFFKRAPGFFDTVVYKGSGANRTVSHGLGVVPELIIVGFNTSSYDWQVYCSALANTEYIALNSTAAKATGATFWNSTTPTSSVFSVGTEASVNTDTAEFQALLFATCPGVSKVGSYTGTGTTLAINCGFTAGARYVLIKRTDSIGDWYIWDTTRGIIAGNDPFVTITTDAENTATDYIDPSNAGFEISSTAPAAINANGGTYLFLAIA